MMTAPIPANEKERLAALESYEILDTPEESTYDAFTALAREITGTPMSMISLIDEHRQWFKSHLGLASTETSRDEAFCAHIVATGQQMVVNDATADPRFADNPLVTGDPNVRLYAGVPLISPEGYTIGTLCVIDDKPGELNEAQIHALEALARVLMGVLEGRRRFLSLFDSANIDVFTIDPKTATILFASRGALRRLGYSRSEVTGMPVFDIAPALTRQGIDRAIERLRSGGQVAREGELTRRDGTTYPVELRVDMTREQGEERILCVATDLTERKLQQREIQLLLDAMNVAGDVILVYEAGDGTPESMRLAYMNDAYAEQSGYAPDDAIGKPMQWFRQAMPDDEGMRAIREAISRGQATQAEIVSYRKDGTTYWNQVSLHPISGSGAVTHWISIERDITDEVARTSALAEEHDRLLALTRAARRLFTALDARALVTAVGEVVGQLLGNAQSRVLAARDDGAVVPVEELGAFDWAHATKDDALIAQALEQRGRAVAEKEDRAVAYAGRFADARYLLEVRVTRPRTLRSTDLFVFDLIAEYFAVAARNVSLYQELDERRSAVMELNQTKSDLIAMLAHDFRGPLTSIVGFADLTSEIGEVNGEQREFLETIKRSALQLSELATDTLTLSRLERNELSLQIADVDLGEMMRSVIALYSDRRDVVLHVEGDPRIVGDEDRLRQVFANLVDNAIKYSPNGTSPEVRVVGHEDDVTVSIRDRGIGIPQAELTRVFDRFSRASNAKKMRIPGTGFGLFLTKQLVTLHGGTILVDSSEGAGSTFTVTLPRRVDRSAAPRTVVVLDRDRERSFLAYGLQEAGYRVVAASTLEEVLGIADAQPVDVIVVATPEELSAQHAVQFRAFSREREVPLIAIGNENVRQLSPALTLPRPVLIGDVVTGLERLLTPV